LLILLEIKITIHHVVVLDEPELWLTVNIPGALEAVGALASAHAQHFSGGIPFIERAFSSLQDDGQAGIIDISADIGVIQDTAVLDFINALAGSVGNGYRGRLLLGQLRHLRLTRAGQQVSLIPLRLYLRVVQLVNRKAKPHEARLYIDVRDARVLRHDGDRLAGKDDGIAVRIDIPVLAQYVVGGLGLLLLLLQPGFKLCLVRGVSQRRIDVVTIIG